MTRWTEKTEKIIRREGFAPNSRPPTQTASGMSVENASSLLLVCVERIEAGKFWWMAKAVLVAKCYKTIIPRGGTILIAPWQNGGDLEDIRIDDLLVSRFSGQTEWRNMSNCSGGMGSTAGNRSGIFWWFFFAMMKPDQGINIGYLPETK